MGSERKLTEEARRWRYPADNPTARAVAKEILILADALEAVLSREQRKDEALRRIVSDHDGCERARAAVDGPRNYEAERLAEIAREALAAVPVETQEAAEPDDYSRPGWRMFPVL